MKTLHFSIRIDAPRAHVWDTMLGEATYREWTAAFAAGSRFEGDWDEGSRIRFLAPGEDGDLGMVSRIRTNRPHELVSIEHLGIVQNGQEITSGDEVQAWAGSLETYGFRDVEGGTEVTVDMDSDEEHVEMFEGLWPKALERLKEVAER